MGLLNGRHPLRAGGAGPIMMFKPATVQDNAVAEAAIEAAGPWPSGGGAAPGDEAGERLRRFGARALSDVELVAWVVAPGRVGERDHDGARSLLARHGLAELGALSAAVLAARPGLGPARARRLLAALELGRRAARPVAVTGLLVRRPEDLGILLRDEFRGLDRERFIALYLDARHRVRALETVSTGSLNASLVHPREVFKPAIALSAAAVIVAHNHPSGDPRPSGDDLELTGRLDRCGELLGIALLDHLVVGDADITSIREYGWPAPAHG